MAVTISPTVLKASTSAMGNLMPYSTSTATMKLT